MRLTELIMKDPAADLSLKQQPLEYYKCHLHTVLERKKEWRDEVNGDKAQVNESKMAPRCMTHGVEASLH